MNSPNNAISATEDSSVSDVKKMFLNLATIAGRPNVYFIGPFGRRVSFASQQRRALNTVWAVGKDGKLENNPDVAVIGGGLAGLMTCAALITQRCNVTLIEMNDSVLARQTATTHRYVHPTVNFWPEKELSPTTEFPFLDWYEDKCSSVIATVRDEWEQFFQGRLTETLLRTKVASITNLASGRAELKLLRNFGRNNEKEELREFDRVFVAAGFELQFHSHEPSYWQPDSLDSEHKFGTQKFLVAGTGDGGVIDAIRLIHSNFDGGKISLTLAKALDEQGTSVRVSQIEQDVWEQHKNDETKASLLYSTKYALLLSKLSIATKKQLEERHPAMHVTLLGKLPQPFGLHVAPIHKLLVASALEAGALTYIQGELEEKGDWYQIKSVDGSFDAREVERTSEVVVRVGPLGPLSGLLTTDEVNQLRVNQAQTADLLAPVQIDYNFFSGVDKIPLRDASDKVFIKFRKRIVDDYLFKNFRVTSKIGYGNGSSNITIVDMRTHGNDDAPFPKMLFGIQVLSERLIVGEGL